MSDCHYNVKTSLATIQSNEKIPKFCLAHRHHNDVSKLQKKENDKLLIIIRKSINLYIMGDEHQYQTSKDCFKENMLEIDIIDDDVFDAFPVTAGGHVTDVVPDNLLLTSNGHKLHYSSAVYHMNATDDMKMRYETLTTFRAPFIKTGISRTKRWIPPKDMYIYKTLKRHYLDFCIAEFVHKTCTIHMKSDVGRVYIIVPLGVNITFDAIDMIGQNHMIDESNDYTSTSLNANCMMPTIHITGLTVVGGVHIKVNTKALPLLLIN